MTRESHESREEQLYTIRYVARLLQVDTTTVRRWVTQGLLEAIVLPHKGKRQSYRIREHVVRDILQGKRGSFTHESTEHQDVAHELPGGPDRLLADRDYRLVGR